MCGIIGVFAYHYAANPLDRNEFACALDQATPSELETLRSWFGACDRIGLGRQPMTSVDRRAIAVFNGEIYNYAALRSELEAKGRRFRSHSDTEVLLHLYAEKGADLVDDLRGAFAFAIWDEEQRLLLLARDPSGAKPLYYVDDGWTFRFGCRQESIRVGGPVLEPGNATLQLGALSSGHPSESAAGSDVRSLPPGSTLVVNKLGPGFPSSSVLLNPTRRGKCGSSPAPRMNVLALVTDGFGGRGGIARYNRDFISALAASDRIGTVTVLPRFGESGETLPDGVTQIAARPGAAAWSIEALKLAACHRFDLVFSGHIYSAPVAAMLARALGKPLWLQTHGVEAWEPLGFATRAAAESSALVTAVSRYTRQRLLQWAHIDPARVRVLPNTVSPAYLPRERRADLLARHALVGRKVILTVGRLASGEQYKGHDRIIRVLPQLALSEPMTSYLIVGTGDDQTRLEALAHETGVAERVCFAGEVVDGELPDYFALADVFAMPSTGEGFGIVFLEAAASGMPVIGGNRDGSVDALADGVIGRAIDPDDAEALIDALVDGLAGNLPRNSAAVGRFTFRAFADHVDALVRSIG